MSDSPILCTIDLEAPGKQFGRLQVPRSSNESGWSNQYVPIVTIARGEGPTALVLGGVHGDEPEGQVAALNLARDLHAGARRRARDRDPVRLDRRLARLHAALAVGREHEPLVPGIPDRPGGRAARALPLDGALPALGRRRSTCTAAGARASACRGRRCTGSTIRSSAGRWSTRCSTGTPTGAASTSTSPARACSSARQSARGRSSSRPSSVAAVTSRPRSTGSR